jgi:hypothetical protein
MRVVPNVHLMLASDNFPPKVLPVGHYIYLHRRLSDGKVFYVGKGQGKRAWLSVARTNAWQVMVCQHGKKVEIFMENVSPELIDENEQAAIRLFVRMGEPLVNNHWRNT